MQICGAKVFLFPLMIVALLFSGCRPKKQAVQERLPKLSKIPTDLVFLTNEPVADFSIVTALESGEYARLETLAASLRKSKAAYDNGRWKLTELYEELSSVPDNSPEDDYLRRINLLHKWSTRDPRSLTANIALSHAYVAHAWQARGNGYANTVTDEGWRKMKDRIQSAKGVLLYCKDRRSECPGWWNAMQRVALGEGWDRKTYEAFVAQAIKQEPTYQSFYNDATYYLLPRWHGGPGDWEKFATEAADRLGGEEGDILYARIVWRMQQRHVYGNIFHQSQASWPRVQKGFEAMRKRNPESIAILNEYCNLAGWGSGRLLAKQLFDQIGNRVHLNVWDAKTFASTRAWTYGN